MGKTETAGLLKINELAKRTGVNISTIKYYIKEDFIQPAFKTGRNMSYYEPSCVQRIILIKKLQKERYFPLSEIKRLLNGTSILPVELDLLDAIHKVDVKSFSQQYSLAEAAKKTGLTRRQIGTLCENGLLVPDKLGSRQVFSLLDIRVMFAVKRREDAGIPFAQTVKSMMIFSQALRQATAEDVDSFINSAIMTSRHTPDEIARMIRVSDETLDEFITIRRIDYNRKYGAERIEILERFTNSIRTYLKQLSKLMTESGEAALASRCKVSNVQVEEPQDAISSYSLLLNGTFGTLSEGIRSCAGASAFFRQTDLAGKAGEYDFLHQCLYLGWVVLAPPQLGFADRTPDTCDHFLRDIDISKASLAAQVLDLLHIIKEGKQHG